MTIIALQKTCVSEASTDVPGLLQSQGTRFFVHRFRGMQGGVPGEAQFGDVDQHPGQK
jgi:hypothetical protein